MKSFLQKTIAFFVIFLLALPTVANMASPYEYGTRQGVPKYSSRNITILHEQLNIQVQNNNAAIFDVTYTIEVDSLGSRFPLIFDCGDHEIDGFSILIDDSIDVPLLTLSDNYRKDNSLNQWIDIFRDEYGSLAKDIMGFKYFEVEALEIGVHTICVTYTAIPTIILWDKVKQYAIEYNLRPAINWKEFHSLDISIDLSQIEDKFEAETDLPDEYLVAENKWQFNKIAQDTFTIEMYPKLTGYQQFLIDIGAMGFAIFFAIIFIICNIIFQIISRIRENKKAIIVGAIAGAVLFPAWTTFWLLVSNEFINNALGDLASNRAGFLFLIFFLLLLFIPVYLLVAYILDVIVRHVLKKKRHEKQIS